MELMKPSIKEADMEDTLVEVTPVVDMEEIEVGMVEVASAAMAAVAGAITEVVAGAVHMLVRQWMQNLKPSLTTKTHIRNAVFIMLLHLEYE